jgi:hypothetical protein
MTKKFIVNDHEMDLDPLLYQKPKEDLVNEPEHYGSTCNMEAIDVIELFSLNFNLGNVIKYVLRCERKGNKTQDLQKAIWYLNREINA